MASVSEQLASRINLGSIAKAEDLKKRILFTLLALIVYRIGSYIPVPGIDPTKLSSLFDQNQGTNNFGSNNSFDRQTIANQKSINDNVSLVSEPEVPQVAPPGRTDLTEITSPMVGTFYRAAAPGEEPFVEIGNNIKVGQTICILEAMKLMNEIESEFNAEIVEILVENGTPVEFGQVLMRVKQS